MTMFTVISDGPLERMVRMSEGRGVKSPFGIAQIDKVLCQIHAKQIFQGI